MRRSFFAVLVVILAPVAFAQLDSNTITVSASRAIYVQPDQIAIGVFVDTGLDVTLDQVLAAVQPAGISASNFSSVYPAYNLLSGLLNSGPISTGPISIGSVGGLEWAFTVNVPFASMKDTLNLLASVLQTLAKQPLGMTLTFGPQGLQVSPQAQAAQACNTPNLMADARSQALALANAAGFGVGSVVALSDGSGSTVPRVSIASLVPTSVASLTSILGGLRIAPSFGVSSVPSSLAIPSPTVCSIVVKFRLTQM
jgi:uncharacterized protein YggE